MIQRKYFNRSLPGAGQVEAPFVDRKRPVTPSTLIRSRFEALTPLRAFYPPGMHARRVSLVTDSINSGSLYGGVATSLIFSALLANRLKATLRIITRTERSRPDNFEHILSVCGITLEGEVEFRLAAFYDQNYQIDILPEEIFVTTSWWTTAAVLPCVSASQIIYLLQEDERMFYPFGDERLKCEAILRNTEIRFLINTKLLYVYLLEQELHNIGLRGAWFEPAFPSAVFPAHVADPQMKKRFLFYARPNNVRNLFYHGLDVIEKAVTQGVLNPDTWEIILVGKDIPAVSFSGHLPIRHENMTWSQYAALIGTIDLGLVLMYSPHPSYPPLDLAASGAVVVTNRYANKKDLSGYSPNILCSDLEPDALVDALRVGVELALDQPARERNFRQNNLQTDWSDTFAAAINFVAGGR